MTRPAWIGFVSGLHLALLQFGLFFTLVIHLSATYVTYATTVICWMLGTLAGLLWRGLDARLAVAIGVASYLGVHALVAADPLALRSLPFAGAGVLLAGLWAGRFFVALQPHFAGADKLFLHENNGFLLGVIGVFVGFTLLGKSFLLVSPLVSGALVLTQLSLLGAPAPVARAVEAPGSEAQE